MRAVSQEEFKEAFSKALTLNRPVVIDCQIDSDDKSVAYGSARGRNQ